MGTLQIWPHYEIQNSIKSIADLKVIFPDGQANELNWCFLSTSGVHGSYATLDGIHKPEDEEAPFRRHITVLVVHPRLVVLKYGNIDVETDEDEKWLRGLVNSSIEAVKKSQEGNL